MYFRNQGLQKTSLDQCLKSRVLEDPSADDITSGLKSCWNLNDRHFTIFINDCEGNCTRKSLF